MLTVHLRKLFCEVFISLQELHHELMYILFFLEQYPTLPEEIILDDFVTFFLAGSIFNRYSTSQKGSSAIHSVFYWLTKSCEMFLAGQETTANAVSFVLMQIGRHPEVLQRFAFKLKHHCYHFGGFLGKWRSATLGQISISYRMYTEVDEVVGSKAEVGFEDVNKLEYVGMVWKETLRLYPPVPVTFRDVNRQGYKIDGYEVPYNTQVLVNMTSGCATNTLNWSIHLSSCCISFELYKV